MVTVPMLMVVSVLVLVLVPVPMIVTALMILPVTVLRQVLPLTHRASLPS
jgi:hypothetical protein